MARHPAERQTGGRLESTRRQITCLPGEYKVRRPCRPTPRKRDEAPAKVAFARAFVRMNRPGRSAVHRAPSNSAVPLVFSQFTNRNPPGASNGGVLGGGVTWS